MLLNLWSTTFWNILYTAIVLASDGMLYEFFLLKEMSIYNKIDNFYYIQWTDLQSISGVSLRRSDLIRSTSAGDNDDLFLTSGYFISSYILYIIKSTIVLYTINNFNF